MFHFHVPHLTAILLFTFVILKKFVANLLRNIANLLSQLKTPHFLLEVLHFLLEIPHFLLEVHVTCMFRLESLNYTLVFFYNRTLFLDVNHFMIRYNQTKQSILTDIAISFTVKSRVVLWRYLYDNFYIFNKLACGSKNIFLIFNHSKNTLNYTTFLTAYIILYKTDFSLKIISLISINESDEIHKIYPKPLQFVREILLACKLQYFKSITASTPVLKLKKYM